ncbi:hypothetical protein [Goodfellowiella coeruleoviolacea]|uniref:hypothetical protein n=1 Tax=Goodfellowiella coeruleoviolacea TaxID=334858 RepID=UPI0020A534FB|nr:hypothetical protein [Goodfellowiella coeruleoviolacea]
MTALLVWSVLGLVATTAIGGLWRYLITAFPLDDHLADQPRQVDISPAHQERSNTSADPAPDYHWMAAWPGLPSGHAGTTPVHIGQEAA